ncbi:Enkurin domain [Plasmopara halstedii]|uniref:Enkurin domain n=1 Tax=Plasmopara halstedii TaxID=4781 RepID=A0A0P1A4Q0_PLAHL|nr:Enkurin domain [Plasmopara halstedii]CEG35535.1 Enkurin domain [Plasmopara halstedii]|eukprot:XP_024571904.1 Enkurin domain [Plasmopara halstedii]
MSASVGYRRRDANASDAIAAILHPDEGFREKQQRKGVVPKNFERENKLRVKRMQADNRERQKLEEARQQQEFKLTRFKNVLPRVFQVNESSNREQIKRHEYLRRSRLPLSSMYSSSSTPQSETSTLSSSPPSTTNCGCKRHIHRKAPVPSLQELERREKYTFKKKNKEQIDFVNANAWEVIRKPPVEHNQKQVSRPVNPNFGRIPRYLMERKEQWAREEEERRKNAPDPDCPPGMILLDEDERVHTLDVLRISLAEAQRRINTLPLRIETLSQIRRKNDLEAKVREIEGAIKVFDRPKVYVAAPLVGKHHNRTASIAA